MIIKNCLDLRDFRHDPNERTLFIRAIMSIIMIWTHFLYIKLVRKGVFIEARSDVQVIISESQIVNCVFQVFLDG